MNRSAPLTIHNARQQKQITLQWSSEEIQHVSYVRLRAACPCAQCRAARSEGRAIAADQGIQVQAINPMSYGLQFTFSDGHDRGIYPWNYLYELQ